MQTQNSAMRRRPCLPVPKTTTRIPTKVAMTTASRATIMIFFLFFERQPTSKDFELWHLQTFENALDSPWLTVSLSSSRTSTCELLVSIFLKKKYYLTCFSPPVSKTEISWPALKSLSVTSLKRT